MTRAVWRNDPGPLTSEQSFRTNLDFLLGHSMLLQQGNRLALELADMFSMDLPKEGQGGRTWCFVIVLDQGKSSPYLLPPFRSFFFWNSPS